MRKLLGLGAVVALAGAFAFASAANATHKGPEHGGGKKPHAAFNAFVADPVPCADSVALVPTGSIAVGVDEPQCYTYDMVILDAALGSVHRDELTANWDLDGASEAAVDDATGVGGSAATEDALTGSGNGVTGNDEDGATGTVAGVVDAGTEEDAVDGVVDTDCSATDGVCDGLPVNVCLDGACDGTYNPVVDGICADGVCDGNFADNVCDDGLCDGVDLAGGCNDGVCDGLSVVTETDLTCSVFASQPDSAIKNNDGNVPAKQPEILIVTIDTFVNATNECTVQVSARTVLNPGESDPSGGADPDLFDDCGDGVDDDVCAFEPRKCEPLREFTRDPDDKLAGIICTDGDACMSGGVPFNNFETLNLGIKSFNDDGTIIVNGGGFVATKLSVELEPVGCDTDGGGETDVDEAAGSRDPLDPSDDVI